VSGRRFDECVGGRERATSKVVLLLLKCSVLQCVAVCCSVLQKEGRSTTLSDMQCDVVCCSVLQCVAVCCRKRDVALLLLKCSVM